MTAPIVDPHGVYWIWDWRRELYTTIYPTGQVWSHRDAISRGDVSAAQFIGKD
jgi:hypothetical protein